MQDSPSNDPEIAPGLHLPRRLLSFQFSRSSGPGGQNVNKVETRVELSVEPAQIPGYPPAALARLRTLAGRRLDAAGVLTVASSVHRDQLGNRTECLDRLLDLIRRSLIAPRRRIPTRKSRGQDRTRIESKKRRSRTKGLRRSPGDD